MNIFRVVRRALWSITLAICIVIGCVYLAVSQAFLSTSGLTHIVKESHLAATVRKDVLLPQVLSLAQSTQYATVLDNKTVTDAFNATVTDQILEAKLAPAINAMSSWLNSKSPTVDFSINMSDLAGTFADQLGARVKDRVASLPACTIHNTLSDAENGVCQTPFVSSESIGKAISVTIKNNPIIGENVAITPQTLPLFSSTNQLGSDLPSYLNMLYSLSLVSAAIIVIVGLWLLFKHRLAGIITLGSACLLAAIGLFVTALVISHFAAKPSNDQLLVTVTSIATQSLNQLLNQQAQWLAIGGSIAIILATILLVIFSHRQKSRGTIQLHSSSTTIER